MPGRGGRPIAVRRARGAVDLVLVHDLEAVLPIRLARPGCPVVWDVHEDLVASVGDRSWVPRPLRAVVRLAVGAVERAGRVGVRLILAETSYAERLGDWPVVPNTTVVPATEPEYQLAIPQYVVYVGRLSHARGIDAMIDLGRDLAAEADVVLVGTADPDVRERLEAADAVGNVRWLGPLPNPEAMELLAGAVAGLCLLAPLPNYVGSMPTKVYEYSAHGVPAIVSPLPLARRAVDESGAGIVVDPTDRAAVEAAVRAYLDDPARRRARGSGSVLVGPRSSRLAARWPRFRGRTARLGGDLTGVRTSPSGWEAAQHPWWR